MAEPAPPRNDFPFFPAASSSGGASNPVERGAGDVRIWPGEKGLGPFLLGSRRGRSGFFLVYNKSENARLEAQSGDQPRGLRSTGTGADGKMKENIAAASTASRQ